MKLLVATRNTKKLGELERILQAAHIDNVELLSLSDVPAYPERPESGATFADNAFIKAVDAAVASGYVCVADDSGLSIDALSGMPGVLSARWSGRHGDDRANYELVLAQLADVPDNRRGAAFRTACAVVAPAALFAANDSSATDTGASESGPAPLPTVAQVREALIAAGFPAVTDDAGNLLLVVEGRWPGHILRQPVGDNGFGYDPIFAPTSQEGGSDDGQRSAAELDAATKDAFSHRGRALRALAPALALLAEQLG